MKNNRRRDILPENNAQTIILAVLVLAVATTFIFGGIYGKSVLAKNKSEYESWRNESILEEKRVSQLNIYEKINEGREVNVLILGDGIGKNIGEGLEEDTWYNKLANSISEEYGSKVKISNKALQGDNVINALNEYRNLDNNYDLVLLCFGKFKEKEISEENFKSVYEDLIREIQEDNNNVSIISIIQNGVESVSKTFNIINSLSNSYGLDIANVNEAFNQSNETDLISQNTGYPTDKGYNIYFETVKSVIDNNINISK